MDEKAIGLADGVHKKDVEGCETEKGQGHKIDEAIERLENGAADGDGEIELFGAVVGDMDCPEYAGIMIDEVQHEIEKILA